ncbi:MAG: zf-HC2 domain-containing protein [Planctomycetaceae bacterium]|nr:zf-HC2 domain-containing protein [Planctomycetaceae bacterium]
MNCDDVNAKLSEFYDRELPADQMAEISEHVNNCDGCTAELRSFGQIGRLFREQGESITASGNWAGIVVRLDEQTGRFSKWRFPRSSYRLASLIAASLIAAVVIGYWAALRTSHDGIELVAAAHVHKTLTRFPQKPRAVVDELSTQYDGTLVSLAAAKELLGYEPVVSLLSSSGYRVASTHVLKMPCCKCSASLCVRQDGSEFLIFEHNEEQPMWFGDSPTISARCCGQVCHCAQMPDQLAVTWKVGPRFVTAIGVEGLDEIARLMAIVSLPNSAV